MITTIALDLDGTLLGSNGFVSSPNQDALRLASSSGIRILICSGRHHFDISWVANSLPVSCLVSSNGAFIADKAGAKIASFPMSADEVAAVADAILSTGLSGIWYTNQRIVIDPMCPVLPWYRKRNKAVGEVLNLTVEADFHSRMRQDAEEISKVAVSGYSPDQLELLDGELSARGIQWTSSAPHNREIMGRNVTKAKAVEFALDFPNAGSSQLVAIGDGKNDIDLIDYADIGIAMGNACNELKAVACGVCPSNADDGVATVINLILDGRIEEICAEAVAR